jgi:LysM repeat protein
MNPPRSFWSQYKLPAGLLVLSIAIFVIGTSIILLSLFVWAGDPTPLPTLVAIESTLVPATLASATPTAEPATPTASPSSEPPQLTATPATTASAAESIQHTVSEGENLWDIAALYQIGVEEIAAFNQLTNADQLAIGQVLLIPVTPPPTAQATAVIQALDPTPTLASALTTTTPIIAEATIAPTTPTSLPSANSTVAPGNWDPSLTTGDLETNYPLLLTSPNGSLQIHYQPQTYPAQNIEWLSPLADDLLLEIQDRLGGRLFQPIDLYLGGTLFAANPALQGLSQSGLYRTFILVNGTFHQGETEYIITHELTHVAATNIFGVPTSLMLHEGLATYLPQHYLTDNAGYLPHQVICAAAMQTAAFRSATQLENYSYGSTGFGGHIRTFINYNLSACFVGYLVETYGMEALGEVYPTSDYSGVYHRTLADLDLEWQNSLTTVTVPVDPQVWMDLITEVADAYESYLAASAGGVHANWDAYLHLNQARLAVNRGRLEQAHTELDTFWSLMGS